MKTFGVVLVCMLGCYVAAENSNTDLADRLKALEDERAKLEAEINIYRKKAKHLLEIFRDVLHEDEDNSSDQSMRKRQLACDTAAAQIAFHARMQNQREFSSVDEVITFDVVHTNIGNGYNSSTGIFTAPRQGNYQLMATVMATDGNSTDVEMVRSSHYPYTICNSRAGTSHSSMGLCVAFVTLEENESVRVRHNRRTHQVLAGGKYSSFSGHLINN
ncbi:cerebellin-1-like [Ylistrum balloti]|uniref:cerebellin-1-like n=1 Tax=Ylistrum balloti TaxID=509963 RepID=UPI0029057DD5|nr:cerebellin-1-like [Ylistrum balloti]